MTQFLRVASAVLLAGALLVPSAACTVNPTITAFDNLNQCGGTLGTSGKGFTPNGKIEVYVLGMPGHSGFWDLGSTQADGAGNMPTFEWGYYWDGYATGPGCAWGSSSDVTVTIMAKDLATGSVTFTTTSTPDCTASWGECPA